MKIFSWMQRKLTGKQAIEKQNSATSNTNHQRQDLIREEFSDWPQGLFAIGTFGNKNNLKQESDKSQSEDHLQDVTPEEVTEIRKEITKILNKQQTEEEDDEKSYENDEDERVARLERSTSAILNRKKDICADQKKGSIGKKSLSFILKKMFVCRSGFGPTPSLRDSVPDKFRMEKILRAILQKKIYPQNSNPKATAKKYLETSQLFNSDSDDETFDTENDGSKWVKTDSDYIVLEI